jgi:hypothetical protein
MTSIRPSRQGFVRLTALVGGCLGTSTLGMVLSLRGVDGWLEQRLLDHAEPVAEVAMGDGAFTMALGAAVGEADEAISLGRRVRNGALVAFPLLGLGLAAWTLRRLR